MGTCAPQREHLGRWKDPKTGKYFGSWLKKVGQPGPGHASLTEHGYRTKPKVQSNPDDLPEAPAVACTAQWYPTNQLYWDKGNIFDTPIEEIPDYVRNPDYSRVGSPALGTTFRMLGLFLPPRARALVLTEN